MDDKKANAHQSQSQEQAARPFEDRRLFMRFMNSCPVQYYCSDNEAAGKGQLRDISANGMGLLTNKRLHVYSHMDISVCIPQSDRPFYTTGEVVWVERVAFDLYRAGIKLDKPELMGVWRVLNNGTAHQPENRVAWRGDGWSRGVFHNGLSFLKRLFRAK